jgi:hypothetical protein
MHFSALFFSKKPLKVRKSKNDNLEREGEKHSQAVSNVAYNMSPNHKVQTKKTHPVVVRN